MLLISHSGGTFGTLNCANLLKGFTEDIFCITSEWDTCIARLHLPCISLISPFYHPSPNPNPNPKLNPEPSTGIARAVRAGKPGAAPSFKMASYVFSTFCGLRPAEPCSLTVVATHELLTQVE